MVALYCNKQYNFLQFPHFFSLSGLGCLYFTVLCLLSVLHSIILVIAMRKMNVSVNSSLLGEPLFSYLSILYCQIDYCFVLM